MKTTFTILFLFSACVTGVILTAPEAAAEFVNTMELGMHTGYRLDQFDWNTAGYNQANQSVNVLSELDWDDIAIWQLGGTGKLGLGNDTASFGTYIRGSIDYGWINDGTVRDSDYNGNNRTEEYSRSLSTTEDDNVFDFSIGLGFEKKFRQDRLTLGVLGGYSYHEQNLRITNGVQVIPDLGPFPGLNSTYGTKWYGPFAGLDLEFHPAPHFSLRGSVEYHWSEYEAEADWNLRSNWAHPVSFRHEADEADGLLATLKGSYLFKRGWTLDLAYVYQDFSAGDGIVRTYFISGPAAITKFNEANWQSSAINLGLSYMFK